MAGVFDKALSPFIIHLDEIRTAIAYIKESLKLKSYLGRIVNWKLGKTYEISLANSFIKNEPVQVRPVLNGLFVTVIAAFEEFLRTIIVLAARHKVQTSRTFQGLDRCFINRHMEYTGRLLASVNNPPAHLNIDFYDLCRRLGTCLPGSTNIEINETAFSYVRGITEIEIFFDCIKAIGYSIEFDDFGRDSRLQKLLQTSGTRDTSKELKETLRAVLRNRHRIAHSGQSYAEITEDVFSFQLNLLELTAICITEHLNGKH